MDDIDNAGEDRGMYESELETVEDKIKIIEKLIEEKDAVRDALKQYKDILREQQTMLSEYLLK